MSGSSWTTWAPSPIGAGLEVAAVLERVAGRRLEFAVRVCDGERPVASGRVIRVVVDTARVPARRRRRRRGRKMSKLRVVAELFVFPEDPRICRAVVARSAGCLGMAMSEQAGPGDTVLDIPRQAALPARHEEPGEGGGLTCWRRPWIRWSPGTGARSPAHG